MYQPPSGCDLADYVDGAKIGDTLMANVLTQVEVVDGPDPLHVAYAAASTTEEKLAVLAAALGLT